MENLLGSGLAFQEKLRLLASDLDVRTANLTCTADDGRLSER